MFQINDGVRIGRIDTLSLQGRDPHPPVELEGHYGTILALDEVIEVEDLEGGPLGLFSVRTSLNVAERTFVLADYELELVRKARYDVGDEVELYGHADGENGPHPSDADQPRRFARILEVHVHPNNDEWVLEYTVAEHGERDSIEEPESVDVHRIKAGEVARLSEKEV